jgi:hypothetical protein
MSCTEEELKQKSYKELRALAVETGACKGNAKAGDIISSLAKHYQALEARATTTTTSSSAPTPTSVRYDDRPTDMLINKKRDC